MASWAGPRVHHERRVLGPIGRFVIRLLSLVVAIFALIAYAPTAEGATIPTHGCWSGYSYNGAQSPVPANGVSAKLTLTSATVVGVGHVAAWIGVGGAAMGPGGSDEWVQAGIAHDAGGSDVLYYEFKRPSDATATYVPLQAVAPGASHTIVVYERAVRDSWRVRIDGINVSAPIMLPGSDGRFAPVATAENWDGGVAGSCNGYSYAFSNLSVRATTWQPFTLSRVLRDPAYSFTLRSTGFLACT